MAIQVGDLVRYSNKYLKHLKGFSGSMRLLPARQQIMKVVEITPGFHKWIRGKHTYHHGVATLDVVGEDISSNDMRLRINLHWLRFVSRPGPEPEPQQPVPAGRWFIDTIEPMQIVMTRSCMFNNMLFNAGETITIGGNIPQAALYEMQLLIRNGAARVVERWENLDNIKELYIGANTPMTPEPEEQKGRILNL